MNKRLTINKRTEEHLTHTQLMNLFCESRSGDYQMSVNGVFCTCIYIFINNLYLEKERAD